MYCINLFHYDYCFNNRIIYIVMTEELVTLDTAKLLKEKGFQQRKYLIDVSTLHHYSQPNTISRNKKRIWLIFRKLVKALTRL